MDSDLRSERLLTLPQVQDIVPYSASHLWRLERDGKFPERVRLGGNRVAWLQSEVHRWVDSKLAARSDNKTFGNSN